MDKHPSITGLKKPDAVRIKGAFTNVVKPSSITGLKKPDAVRIKGAFTKMDKHLPIAEPKLLAAGQSKAQRNIDKKFHKKKWNENLLSQFSLHSQIITCFTDDSFAEKVLSSKAFHMGFKSKSKRERGTALESRQFIDEDCVEAVDEKYFQAKVTSTLVSSSNQPPSKSGVCKDISLYSNTSPSCLSLPVVATKTTDSEVPDAVGCSLIQFDEKISEDSANSLIDSSAMVDPLRRSGFDCTGFGSCINSNPCSSGKTEDVPENVICFNMTQKEVPVNIKLDTCSVIQQRVPETSRKIGTEIADSNSFSSTIDTGCISESTGHGELNSGVRVVTSMTSYNLDTFQNSHGFLENSTKAMQNIIQEVETGHRISIETFHFELENLAIVSINNVPLNGNSLNSSRSSEQQTYPSDWQVISNEEFTVLPTVTLTLPEENKNLLPEKCLSNALTLTTEGSNHDLHQNNDQELNSSGQLSTSTASNEYNSQQSLLRINDTLNVRGTSSTQHILKSKHVSSTNGKVYVRSTSESLPNRCFRNAFQKINSTLKSKDDVAVNSHRARTGQCKGTLSEGIFVPIKSNGVRFVSEMKVVLERNATVDQMAIRNSCRSSSKTYTNQIKVNKLHDSDSLLCSRCDIHFTAFQDLIRHIDGHEADKLFLCYYCQKQFPSKANRIRHMRMHTGEKPFACSICNKSFSRLGNMKSHRNIHYNVKKFCKIWGNNPGRKNYLRWHPPGPSGNQFDKSEGCGNVSPGKPLDHHTQVHSDFLLCDRDTSRRILSDDSATQKLHGCPLDKKPQELNEKQFPNATKLGSQCDQSSFSCDCCPKTFSSSRGLKIHWKLVHVRASKLRVASAAPGEKINQSGKWNLDPVIKINASVGEQNSNDVSSGF